MFNNVPERVRNKTVNMIKSKGYFRNLWYPRYEFQMFPRQLCYLADSLDATKDVEGAIVEIGCAHGLTTTFLYEYMLESGFKKDYVCIDTFEGFTDDDISVEMNQRGNKRSWYKTQFRDNHVAWFKESLGRRRITDIEVIKSDISALDDDRLPERIAFCLIDVDFYQPVKRALEKIYPKVSPGGLIVVDDCWSKPSHLFVTGIAEAYNGALQAYREFTGEQGLPEELVEAKLAVIRKT